MTAALVGALVGVAVALCVAPPGRRWVGPGGHGRPAAPTGRLRRDPSAPASVLLGVAVAVVVGGVRGIVLGVLVAPAALWALRRAAARDGRRDTARCAGQVPVACDLLAALVAAGAEPAAALRAVADAMGEPLGPVLADVRARLVLGADARSAWAGARDLPELAPVATAMVRVWDSGAAIADSLHRVAADLRAARRAHLLTRARVVGVRAVLPLGLCFLPGFLLIGVLPVVASLIGEVLSFGR